MENEETLRLAGVIRESIVDGPGWRFVVFAQGCPHHCEGCQNPQTHAFDGGYITNTENLLREIKKDPLLSGVTLSGGEPFCQAEPLAALARKVHALGLNVMTYSGAPSSSFWRGATETTVGASCLTKPTFWLTESLFLPKNLFHCSFAVRQISG